jgi:hypothetical protein
MSNESAVEQLLRWRLKQAEAEAPRRPSAARLLELSRPWWEIRPEKFQRLVERVSRIEIAYGHAMENQRPIHRGHPVPTLIVRGAEELETSARILSLSTRDGRLNLRFQLDPASARGQEKFEATFLSNQPARALLFEAATLSVDGEYRIDAELATELARDWEPLKVMDKMPFRFILHADINGG